MPAEIGQEAVHKGNIGARFLPALLQKTVPSLTAKKPWNYYNLEWISSEAWDRGFCV